MPTSVLPVGKPGQSRAGKLHAKHWEKGDGEGYNGEGKGKKGQGIDGVSPGMHPIFYLPSLARSANLDPFGLAPAI